ncbi:hypothetical protein C8R43DRAFT_910147 [Mycena crocata]|nr:hypothetical protein C8R43DRAFT_910147 [Mycena crocata]
MNTRNWLNEDDTQLNHRILSTLNPAELKSTDYTILSHAVHPSVAFLPRTQSFPIRFFKKDSTYQPFPPGTRGFLYFRSAPQHLHPMAGGVRFRITPAAHPSTFSAGYDLLHQGLPWQVALRNIATATGPKVVLRDQLLHEGLITQEQLHKCLAATSQKKRIDPKLTLYHLNQPFPVTFDQSSYVWIVGRSESKCWAYAYMFADNRKDFRPLVRPYSGSALAQFELSTLPEHAGTETLAMRIVKMLQAPTCVLPDYDGYIPPPVEGELVRRPMGHARATRVQPWYCDVSGPSDSAAILRMLVQVHSLPLTFFLVQRRNQAPPTLVPQRV